MGPIQKQAGNSRCASSPLGPAHHRAKAAEALRGAGKGTGENCWEGWKLHGTALISAGVMKSLRTELLEEVLL